MGETPTRVITISGNSQSASLRIKRGPQPTKGQRPDNIPAQGIALGISIQLKREGCRPGPIHQFNVNQATELGRAFSPHD